MDAADFVVRMERSEPSLKPEWLLRPTLPATAHKPATSPRAGELCHLNHYPLFIAMDSICMPFIYGCDGEKLQWIDLQWQLSHRCLVDLYMPSGAFFPAW